MYNTALYGLDQAGIATRSVVGLSSSGLELELSSDSVVSSVADQRKNSDLPCCSEDTSSVVGALGSVIGIFALS